MGRPKAARTRHETLRFAQGAHHRNLFLIARALGKHAQLQQRALATGEVHHHVGVVQDVGDALGVALVEVVMGH
jgi:hypothetical protein